MIIDAFCHVYPKEYLNYWAKAGLVEPSFATRTFNVWTEPAKDMEHFIVGEARLQHMDKYNIDMQILSLALPAYTIVNPDQAVELARIANDGIAELIAKHPQRFQGVATLPLLTMDKALDELDRSIKDLGLKGVQIFGNVNGKSIDSPEFIPLYEKVVEYDIPVLLHPANWQSYEWVDEYKLNIILGWPFDTSLAMCRLVFGGILERFPNLKIITHHGGAMISFFSERISEAAERSEMPLLSKEGKKNISKPALEYFKKFYNDTVVIGWTPALELVGKFFGYDHLVFGTDYPFSPEQGSVAIKNAIRVVNELNVSEDEKKIIFEKNAKRLFKLV